MGHEEPCTPKVDTMLESMGDASTARLQGATCTHAKYEAARARRPSVARRGHVASDKADAARAYASQLGFQFGGAAAMDERLGRIWSERFRAPI